jgi:formylglycine-generating enzyme required for sulfatase activity
MGSNPSYFKDCGGDCPVEQVSWDDVQEFIRKLNSMEGGARYRLPTEAEWEYAATSGGRDEVFSGGDNIDEVAWYNGNSGWRTHPVGQKKPNGLGLYDMSGNVWERCSDWYGSYPSGSVNDPAGPSFGFYRVNRGGGWDINAIFCRAANRNLDYPDNRFDDLGFRLVCLGSVSQDGVRLSQRRR